MLLRVGALALLAASCRSASTGAATDAGSGDAETAPATLPEGAKACGHPAATPTQIASEFLTASKNRDLQSMMACFKPKHRDKMQGRIGRLEELTVLSYTLGRETIDGDTAEVEATTERYDGRGGIEHKRDPLRFDREEGAWYLR
ncbi:hypothetical protein [Chondromyces crocatus]|uniref:Lipoprotein n=1 Tax=Chondromyces crocatus TaxID=52 RepID=A0A0K1E7A7_CHOCO|nr:hypothetical protein [Chondromyces crocatus]AKT36766.1 uncharacterized protein CMC5_008870 [Chondromyces crocatus]